MKTFELSQTTLNAWNTARNEKPVYMNFAASKISQAVKPNTIVEFTDFTGRKHKVVCRNKPEMLKAMKFFSTLKTEKLVVIRILQDYPLYATNKKHATMARRELRQYLKLSPKAIDNILTMNLA